jgi:hypothetical protein
MRSRVGPVLSEAVVRPSPATSTSNAAPLHKQPAAAEPNDHSPAAAQVFDEGIRQLTPTNEFGNATLLDINIPLAAVRHVREVATRILRRLEDADASPPPPAKPDLNN